MVKPLALLALCSSHALAHTQPETIDREPDPTSGLEEGLDEAIDRPEWSTSLRLEARHTLQFDTDVDSSDASLTTNTTRLGARIGWTRSDARLAFGLSLGGTLSDYDFENASTMIATLDDDPFDLLTTQRITLDGRYAFDQNWGIAGLIGLEAAYEAGADIGDSLQIAYGAFGTWTSDDRTFTIGFGVGGFSRLDEDPIVFPFITVDWQIEDDLRLATDGLGLGLTYDATDELALGLFGRFERTNYRLDDDHAGRVSEGSFRDNRVLLGARLAWSPASVDGLTLTLSGGANVYRELQFLDDDGDELFKEETDPQAFLRFDVRFVF